MSVIVKGMEMPKYCLECRLYVMGASYCKGYRCYQSGMESKRPDWCPLIEIPTSHGRLGDLDKLFKEINIADDYGADTLDVLRLVKDSPTIIEAER